MQLKLSEIKSKLILESCYIIILFNSFFKNSQNAILSVEEKITSRHCAFRQGRWFFIIYLISGNMFDRMSIPIMKLPRMVVNT